MQPDGYIASLLEKHSANIVNLDDTTLVRRSAYDPKSGQEYLPPMPERRRLLRTDEEDEIEKLAKPRDTSAIGRMKDAVGWLFGTTAYEGVKERPDSIYKRTSLEKGGTPRDYDNEDGWTLPTRTNNMPDPEPEPAPTWNPFSIASRWLWGSGANDQSSNTREQTEFGSAEQSTPMLGQLEKDNGAFDPDAYSYHSPFANNPLHPDYQPPSSASARPPSFASQASTLVPPYPAPQQPQYKSLFSGLSGRLTRTESADSLASGKVSPYDPSPAMYVPPSPGARGLPPLPTLAGVGVTSAFTEHIDTSPQRPPAKMGLYTHPQSSQSNLQHPEHSGHTRMGSAELALRNDYDEYEGDSLIIDDAELDELASQRGQLSAHHRRPSGSIVYIRMSDGRLVRKLSTIMSERETNSRETSLTDLSYSAGGRSMGTSRLPGGW